MFLNAVPAFLIILMGALLLSDALPPNIYIQALMPPIHSSKSWALLLSAAPTNHF
jgi:hypothetical protein